MMHGSLNGGGGDTSARISEHDGGDMTPLEASLSSQYLARRFARSQGTTVGAGGLGHGQGHMGLTSPASYRGGPGSEHRAYAPPGDFVPATGTSASGDVEYKLESLQLMLSGFKTKMRADFDATFTSVERKARTQRKEILAHVTASLEEVEARLGASLKTNLGDYQLLEIEFRKNLKMDLYTLRNEMETAVRNEEDLRQDMSRKIKMQESVALEMRQKLEEILIGRGGGGGPVGALISSSAGTMHLDQQLISFQHSLDSLQTKFALELLAHRKEGEMKNVDLAHQILDLRRIIEALLTNEEASQRAQADLIRASGEKCATEVQARVDESLANMNALLKNLYRNLELSTQNQDVLHAQLSELQARDNGTGPANTRRVTQAQLDGVEEKLLAVMQGPTGVASATTMRDLTSTVDLHARKLEHLQSAAREALDEGELRARIAIEAFKKDLTLATEGRVGNLALDLEIVRRKVDLLQPELLQQEVTGKIVQVEKDISARLLVARDEAERSVRAAQSEAQASRERHQALERRTDELTALVHTLSAQLKDLTASSARATEEGAAREKKLAHEQALRANEATARESKLANDAAARESKLVSEQTQRDAKHAHELAALRRDLEEAAQTRERDLRTTFTRAEEDQSRAITRVEEEQARYREEQEKSLLNEIESSARKIDQEIKRVQAAVQEVDSKARRTEDVMRVAEELARSNAKELASNATPAGEFHALQSLLPPLQLQVKLLQEKQEHILRTLTDSVVAQSSLQNSVAASQREVERALAQTRQNDLEATKQHNNSLVHARGDLETSLAAVDARLTKEIHDARLKVQDLEHTLKLTKRGPLSPRAGDGASDSGASIIGGPVLRESALRPISLQVEELEFRVHSLSQGAAALKVSSEDLAPRVDSLEREVGEVRKRSLMRDAAVDEALRVRLETGVFDRFRREFTAHTQSQQATTLAAAQTALATAQQAKHAVSQQAPMPWASDFAPVPAPVAAAPFELPEPARSPEPVRAPGRAGAPAAASEGRGASVSPKSYKSVLRRSLEPEQPQPKSPKNVHFAEASRSAASSPDAEVLPSSFPALSSPATFAELLPSLESGHRVLKHFSHGPAIPKLLFYSARPLPNASTGALPQVSERDAAPGFVHWVEPDDTTRAVLPMTTLMVSRVTAVAAGKITRAFMKAEAATVSSDLCFSILTADRSLEVQTTSRAHRDAWVRALTALLRQHRVQFDFQGDATCLEGPEVAHERQEPKQEATATRAAEQPIEEEYDSDASVSSVSSVVESSESIASPSNYLAAVQLAEEDQRAKQTKADAERARQKAVVEAAQASEREFEVAELARERAEAEVLKARAHQLEADARKKAAKAEEVQRAHEARMAEEAAQKEATTIALEAKRLQLKQETEAAEAAEAATQKRLKAEREAADESARLHAERLAQEQEDAERVQAEAAAVQAKIKASEAAKLAAATEEQRQKEVVRQAELDAAKKKAEAEAAAAQAKADAEAKAKAEAQAKAQAAKTKAEADAAKAKAEAEAVAKIETDRIAHEKELAAKQAAQEQQARATVEAAAAAAAAAARVPAFGEQEGLGFSSVADGELGESEEDEEDEEDEDDKPAWLHASDSIIQLTLRATNVPRLGAPTKNELVYHISEAGAVGPPQSHQFYVLDRHHLHGLDEEEEAEYNAEHPDCLNGIFDLRFPVAAAAGKKVRVRIYDVLRASPTARMDNLVGELQDVNIADLCAAAEAGRSFTPGHPSKPEITATLQGKQTSVLIMARSRRNLKERRAAGLPAPEQPLRAAPQAAAPTAKAAAPAVVTPVTASTSAPVTAPAPATASPPRSKASSYAAAAKGKDDSYEKGESDDDLNFSFGSPMAAKKPTDSASLVTATKPTTSSSSAPAPAPVNKALGSMMHGDSDTSDDESDVGSPLRAKAPALATRPVAAKDEWDALEPRAAQQAAPVVVGSHSRSPGGADSDDDVSSESDDDAPGASRRNPLGALTLGARSGAAGLGALKPLGGPQSRASGGLASALLSKQPLPSSSSSSSVPATTAARKPPAKSAYKIGMSFGDVDEEDEDEPQAAAPAPAKAASPAAAATAAAPAPATATAPSSYLKAASAQSPPKSAASSASKPASKSPTSAKAAAPGAATSHEDFDEFDFTDETDFTLP